MLQTCHYLLNVIYKVRISRFVIRSTGDRVQFVEILLAHSFTDFVNCLSDGVMVPSSHFKNCLLLFYTESSFMAFNTHDRLSTTYNFEKRFDLFVLFSRFARGS
jgi:hypothetical protein